MSPQPGRGVGHHVSVVLLVFNFAATIVILGLAAWKKNADLDILNGDQVSMATHNSFEGNSATPDLIDSALTAGVVVVGSYIVGLHHVRVRTLPSVTAAQSAAWIAFGLLMLPFALAWKQTALGGTLGDKARVLEVFVIVVTLVHFVYTLLLYV